MERPLWEVGCNYNVLQIDLQLFFFYMYRLNIGGGARARSVDVQTNVLFSLDSSRKDREIRIYLEMFLAKH